MKDRLLADLDAVAEFAREYLAAHPQGAVVGLVGDLGAGKTTFVRACIEAICEKSGAGTMPRVVSPTYAIQQSYSDIDPPVEHFDLYRLNSVNEEALIELGYYEALATCRVRAGFLFVEWPQRALGDALRLEHRLTFRMENHIRAVRKS